MTQDYVNNLKVNQFVELLTSHQSRIHSYILALVPNFNDADDIMQETSKMMWNRFQDFEIGTDFLAWGMKIAHYRILEYRRNRNRNRMIRFNEDVVLVLEKDIQCRQDRSLEYMANLRDCVCKLSGKDRDLVTLRYDHNLKVKEIARRLGRSVQSVYQNLARVHDLLLACVQRKTIQEEVA